MAVLERLRKLCLALPETTERLSHGAPSFFVRGTKTFVMYLDNHYDDGRLAIWCAAPEGMQAALVDWDELAGIVEDAYLTVVPKHLAETLSTETSAGPGSGPA